MRFNIYNALMRKAYLFGTPVLHSGMPIPREDVPQGWYCYDLRGTDRAPHDPCSVVDHAENYHTGSVLSLLPLKSEDTQSRLLGDEFRLTQEFLSLEAFSAENHINAPEIPFRYQLRPATPEEAGLFYALPTEKDEELGTIGCLHIDYGLSGREFNHTWCPRGPEELVTPAFKEELNRVVDDLRQGVLSDFSTMLRLCHIDGGEIGDGDAAQNYGFVLETEGYRYCLRCSPARWECKAYLTVYDLWEQELNQTRGQEPEAGQTMC